MCCITSRVDIAVLLLQHRTHVLEERVLLQQGFRPAGKDIPGTRRVEGLQVLRVLEPELWVPENTKGGGGRGGNNEGVKLSLDLFWIRAVYWFGHPATNVKVPGETRLKSRDCAILNMGSDAIHCGFGRTVRMR